LFFCKKLKGLLFYKWGQESGFANTAIELFSWYGSFKHKALDKSLNWKG